MGIPSGGLPAVPDAAADAALRRVMLADADYLLKLFPDLDEQLVGRYLRGKPLADPDTSEPGPADAPGPGSAVSA